MAKNQNTYEKTKREHEKKRKAEEKRSSRRKRKERADEEVRPRCDESIGEP